MPTLPTKLLLVEDNPHDVRLLREALAENPDSGVQLSVCETLAHAVETLLKSKPDIILADLGLPDSAGLDSVRCLHRAAPELPLVVLTALDDENVAVQSLQEGVQDYLVKGQIDGTALWQALRYAIERQRVQLELLNLALIDDLTGLNNRRGFLNLGSHHVKVAYRTGKPFLVAFIDLDGLKHINDTLGHQEGNHAIVEASNVLKDSFRQSDILARLGGDEFAALVMDATAANIPALEERIQEKLASLNTERGRRYQLSFSMGMIAADLARPTELEHLLSSADALMYKQKHGKPSRKMAIGAS